MIDRILCRTAYFTVFGTTMLLIGCGSLQMRDNRAQGDEQTAGLGESVVSDETQVFAHGDAVPLPEVAPTAEYHFSLGQAYSADGRSLEAVEQYELALTYEPTSAAILLKLSHEYNKQNQNASAFQVLEKLITAHPRHVEGLLFLGQLESSSGNFSDAIKRAESVLRVDSGNEEALILRANARVEQQKFDLAIRELKASLKKTPSAPVYFTLGRVYLSKNDAKSAISAFSNAVQVNEDYLQAQISLAYLYEALGKFDQAKKWYEQVFERSQEAICAQRLAQILVKEGKYAEAAPFLKWSFESDPEDTNSGIRYALIEIEQKHYTEAARVLELVLARVPDSDKVLYYLGGLYSELGEYSKSEEVLAKIPAESTLFSDAQLIVLRSVVIKEGKEVAVHKVTEILKNHPKEAELYIFKAGLLEGDNPLAAISVLELGLSLFESNESMMFQLAALLDRVGRTDDALLFMTRLTEMNPKHAEALNYVGYTWTVQGVKLEVAATYIQRALQEKPTSPYILDSLGWNYYVRGRVKEAIHTLEKALALKEDEAIIHEHLGDVYSHQKWFAEAKRRYQSALAITSVSATMRDSIERKLKTLEQSAAWANGTPVISKRDREPASSSSTQRR